MKMKGPLIRGRFVERPNRFITMVEINGRVVKSHLPDPGRLQELLYPGANLYLLPKPEHSKRKTDYSTVLVKKDNVLISLDSTLPNRYFAYELNHRKIPVFKGWSIIRSELKIGNHRLDFLLKDPGENSVYTEIKSVTFVENRIAQFPDAITERGRQHMKLLQSLKEQGEKAMVIFICQRSDAERFQPMWRRDPQFSLALTEAVNAGVDIKVITSHVTIKEMSYCCEIPVNLVPPNENKNI